MKCTRCNHAMEGNDMFCIECGQPIFVDSKVQEESHNLSAASDKWWLRLLKVIYIFSWLQILWIVPVVWDVNSTEYTYVGGQAHYTDTYGLAFWYSLMAIVIFVVIIRLLKITVKYIVLGKGPEWKRQFSRIF